MKPVRHISNWLALSYPPPNWEREENLEERPTDTTGSWSFFGNYLDQVSSFNSTQVSSSSENEVERKRDRWRASAARRKQKILAEGGAEKWREYWQGVNARRKENKKRKLEVQVKATTAAKKMKEILLLEAEKKTTTAIKKTKEKQVLNAKTKVEVKRGRKKKVDDIKTPTKASSGSTSEVVYQPPKKRAGTRLPKEKQPLTKTVEMREYMAAAYRARMADPVKRERLKAQMKAAHLRRQEKIKKLKARAPLPKQVSKRPEPNLKPKTKDQDVKISTNITPKGSRKSSRHKDYPPKNYYEP